MNEEHSPLIEFVCFGIVAIALLKQTLLYAMKVLDAIGRWCVAIWPTVVTTTVTLAALYLVFLAARFLLEKDQARKKYIFDLKKMITSRDLQLETKNLELAQRKSSLATLAKRNACLKRGLARYHLLLTRQLPAQKSITSQVTAKVTSAFDNIASDFGGRSTL